MEMPEENPVGAENSGIDPKLLVGGAAGIIIIAIAAFLVLFPGEQEGTLTVKVENQEGNSLWRANLTLTGLDETLSEQTDRAGFAVFTGLKTGETFSLTVSGRGFRENTTEVNLDREKKSVTIKLEAERENRAEFRRITFANSAGAKLEGKLLRVELTCSTGMQIENNEREVSSGSMEVEIPHGCGPMIIKVSAAGFETQSHNLDESAIIRLQELEAEEATLIVNVRNEEGQLLDGISVTVKDSFGIAVDEKISDFGQAVFSLRPGAYSVQAFSPSQGFRTAQETGTVSAGEQTRISIVLAKQKEDAPALRARVVDASNGAEIGNSIVTLENPLGEKTTRVFTEDFVELPLGGEGTHKVKAAAEGYTPSEEFEISTGNAQEIFEIELRKCTPSTCGALTITVLDEESLAVANARAALLDTNTGFYLEEYGLKFTDAGGKAEFKNVKPGTYKALAQKYPSEAVSGEFTVSPDSANELTMELIVGKGTINIKAVDQDGEAVPFGFAEFRLESGEVLGKLPIGADGTASLATKADKKVYAVIEAEGYTNHTSKSVQIFPDQATEITARLRREILGKEPKTEFLGIVLENGRPTNTLTAGNNFRAKFRLSVPTENDFEELGFFMRTGSTETIEKDDIFINKVNAPGSSHLKGRTFNAPNGLEEDEQNLTNNDAKWVSIVWDKDEIRQGFYDIEIGIRVRESTVPGKLLPIHYRSYAINSRNEFLRDPFDSELGLAEETGTKQFLYAESYEKAYSESGLEICEQDFCFSERLLDTREDFFIEKPFDVRVFGNYEYTFSITNNSETVHDNAELRIMNSTNGVFADEKLNILDYTVTNADSQEFSSENDTFEIGGIPLGDFRKNKTVSGKFSLRPEELGDTTILFRIVSDQRIVFERLAEFRSVRQEDLNMTVLPETLPAFTEFDLNVSVLLFDAGNDFEGVKDALVRVERTTPDRQKTVFVATTSGEGKAVVGIPASEPGTRIIVRSEKEGHAATTVQLRVTDKIIGFTPGQLKSKLDLTSNTEQRLSLEAKNLVPVNLHLTEFRFFGGFLGLLDEARMNNWLEQYVQRAELQEGVPFTFSILGALSEDAQFLEEATTLNGKLVLEVANAPETVKWPLEIPYSVTISLAEPPTEEGCIEVSLKEWKDSTLSGKAETEFTITNNCLSQGNKPLNLRNLKAKINWKSNKFGNVELHILDPETGQEARNVLGEALYSTFFDAVPAEKQYTALLIFTPKAGTTGERAEFDIIIDAAQLTNAGEQLVGGSNAIQSEIDIIDLSECIAYTPDPEAGLIIGATETEGTINIDSGACGNVTIDFWLCKDDKGCAGSVEGGIIVKPGQFTLSPGKTMQTVLVSREQIPGIYGIGVNVRTPGSNYRGIKTIDALVKPTPRDTFDLSKYEFSVIGTGSTDSAELSNRFFVETITVDASVCDWGEATENKDSWWNWPYAGAGAALGAIKGIEPMLNSVRGAANLEAKAASESLDVAKEQASKTKATSLASKGELEGVCATLQGNASVAQTTQNACSGSSALSGATRANTQVNSASTECQSLQVTMQSQDAQAGVTERTVSAGAGVATTGVEDDFTTTASGLDSSPIVSGMQGIAASLKSAAASYESAAAAAATECSAGNAAACSCATAIQGALTSTSQSVADVEAYSSKQLADFAEAVPELKSTLAETQDTINGSFKKMDKLLKPGSSTLKGAGIMGAYGGGGFLAGGLLGGLFGKQEDACLQRHTAELPDYTINLLFDALPIQSGSNDFLIRYDRRSARIIGNFEGQTIGVMVRNNGISEAKPVYSTPTFTFIQHIHANPTEIERGQDFGPFRVPDRQIAMVEQKVHLKFNTAEREETLPELTFDTLSCVSGNKIGRTGAGAVPKVKLDWSFSESGISENSCLESNENGVYCDATQFSIMLGKRLNALNEFFEQNPELACPENPYRPELEQLAGALEFEAPQQAECFIPEDTLVDGRPRLQHLIEATDIKPGGGISNAEEFGQTIRFSALLMKDGFSEDFKKDFARHYSSERFFDTPDWFHSLGVDSQGKNYGIARLFKEGRIKFTNRFFESERLSSAGTYDVVISITGEDGTYRFFNSEGKPNVSITVDLLLLQEPNPNSAFYSMPLDGMVGLEGGSFNRQGYGVAFANADTQETITINNGQQPLRTLVDAGSNPIGFVQMDVETSIFRLNTSPSKRGTLLEAGKAQGGTSMTFSPSRATPVMLKVNAEEFGEELSAFYTLTSNNAPVETGSSLTYWSGAGACLDTQGVIVTETFDETPDRSATSKDALVDWQRAYAIDFGKTTHTGSVYLRTVFYTPPQGDFKLKAEHPLQKMEFLTPDETGKEVLLGGVSGAAAAINSVEDVFSLVQSGAVCVVDSGRNAEFFWNPKAVYGFGGRERNISELTNSLSAGQTCIGLG